LQRDAIIVTHSEARVLDRRVVRDSGGHREQRWTIETLLRVGELEWPIEMTLTNRDTMLFRMLIGRTALHQRLLVDCSKSYLLGQKPDLEALYLHGDAVVPPEKTE
jgi:hypothetical protein